LFQTSRPSAVTMKSPRPPGFFSTAAAGIAASIAAARLAAVGR
jgi:hypothetical protein